MKKVLLLILPVLATAALSIPAAFAGNGPAPKVTGDVTFTNLGLTQHWVFDAQDLGNGTAKGNVLDEYAGTRATSKVIKVTILSATDAEFTTQVVDPGTNPYLHVGDQLEYVVHDGGEGSKGSGDWMHYLGMWNGGVAQRRHRHSVRRHVGQHPDPLTKLIRPPAAARRTTAAPPGLTQPGALVFFDLQV